MSFNFQHYIANLLDDLEGDGYFENMSDIEKAVKVLRLCENTWDFISILEYEPDNSFESYISKSYHRMYYPLAYERNLKNLIRDLADKMFYEELKYQDLPKGLTYYAILKILFDERLFEMQAFLFYNDTNVQEQLILQFNPDRDKLLEKFLEIFNLNRQLF